MNLLDLLYSAILGVIQGITEWLPISSTGHLLLAQQFMKMNTSEDFMVMFDVVVQFGSILAVIVLYFHKLNPFSSKKSLPQKSETLHLWVKVIIAAVPGAILGFIFDDLITEYLYNPLTIAITLILYGVLFLILESRHRKPGITRFPQMTYKTALLIGIFQVLAFIPGTSRSGATILAAVMLGCSRYVAAEFSFFLAIPMMIGASGYRGLKFILGDNSITTNEWGILLIGTVVSFVVSLFAIKFLMSYIKKHDFKAFGWYRIVVGIVVLLYFGFVASGGLLGHAA